MHPELGLRLNLGRGRDVDRSAPPAQIRTGGITFVINLGTITEAGRRSIPVSRSWFQGLSAATIPAVSINFQVESQRPTSLVHVLSNPRCGSSSDFIAPHRGEVATWAGRVGVVAILPRMTVLVPILLLSE
jgi:hypothetical protein